MKAKEFGGSNPVETFAYASRLSGGEKVAVIAIRTGDNWMESDGIVGHASSWSGAEKILHDAGYRIMRAGGDMSAYAGEDQGEPQEAAIVFVSVHP